MAQVQEATEQTVVVEDQIVDATPAPMEGIIASPDLNICAVPCKDGICFVNHESLPAEDSSLPPVVEAPIPSQSENVAEKEKEEDKPSEEKKEEVKCLRKSGVRLSKRRRCNCPDCVLLKKQKKESRLLKKKVVTQRKLEILVNTRRDANLGFPCNKFDFEDREVLNEAGDLRFTGCMLNTKLGPFHEGERIEQIDWLHSANIILVSQKGTIAETLAFTMKVESDFEPFPLQ